MIRKEKDKSGVECYAGDVAINSHWFSNTMEPSQIFTAFVITVAIEGKLMLFEEYFNKLYTGCPKKTHFKDF